MRALPFIIGSKAYNRNPDCGLSGFDIGITSAGMNTNTTILSENDSQNIIDRNRNEKGDIQNHFSDQSEFTVFPSSPPPPPPMDPELLNSKLFHDEERHNRTSNMASNGSICIHTSTVDTYIKSS